MSGAPRGRVILGLDGLGCILGVEEGSCKECRSVGGNVKGEVESDEGGRDEDEGKMDVKVEDDEPSSRLHDRGFELTLNTSWLIR